MFVRTDWMLAQMYLFNENVFDLKFKRKGEMKRRNMVWFMDRKVYMFVTGFSKHILLKKKMHEHINEIYKPNVFILCIENVNGKINFIYKSKCKMHEKKWKQNQTKQKKIETKVKWNQNQILNFNGTGWTKKDKNFINKNPHIVLNEECLNGNMLK